MLKVEKLHSGYGAIPIINDVSFEIAKGEIVGILGHNGMGKTTLLKTMMGVLPTKQGRIEFLGQELSRMPTHRRIRRGIGYVPQGRGILPGLSVRDNLRFALAATRGGGAPSALEKILAEFPRLTTYLNRAGGALSGGEQQLLALARALIQNPSLILLDEPTEGIQPSIIEEMIEQIREQRDQRGLTVLLVEQNIDFIRALTDRVLVLQKGMIVGQAAAADLTDAIAMGDFSAIA